MQKLKVLEFITNNPNWEALLAEKPYYLAIKHYAGKDPLLAGTTMLSYNQITSDFYNPIVRECRGIIIKVQNSPELGKATARAICVPFFKFGNYGEGYADVIDWQTARVTQKIDGSLIKVWFYEGKWQVSTNGTINAMECDLQTDLSPFPTFGDLFVSKFNAWDDLDPKYTYMFELGSPWNRVVTPWQDTQVFYLGRRHNETLLEALPGDDLPVPKPLTYPLTSVEDVKAAAAELGFADEGYVVVDANFGRVKIKGPNYILCHKLRGEEALTKRRAVSLVLQNEHGEFLAYYPEYLPIFTEVELVIQRIEAESSTTLQRLNQMAFATQKDYAMEVKDLKFASFYFGFRSGKISDIREYLKEVDPKVILKTT